MQISRRLFLSSTAGAALAARRRPPNVVFILIDDFGWRGSPRKKPKIGRATIPRRS